MLQVTHEEIFFVPVPSHNVIEVVENITIQNPATSAQAVVVSLPKGYQSLVLSGVPTSAVHQEATQVTLTGIANAKSLTTVNMTYALPLPSQQAGITFQLHAPYPIYSAKLYLPEGSAALSAQGVLLQTQTVTISGTKFRVFTRPGINAGDNWQINLSQLPSISSSTSPSPGTGTSTPALNNLPLLGQTGQGNTFGAVLNLVLALFILVIGLLSVRATSFGRRRTPLSKEDALYEAWMKVEEAHENGALSEELYDHRRNEIKQKIISERGKGQEPH